jgi:hypothetical protein
MFYKIVYRLSPDELGRERVENRTYRAIYTNICGGSDNPTHDKERNGLGGTWAVIAPKQTTVLSKDIFLELRSDAARS